MQDEIETENVYIIPQSLTTQHGLALDVETSKHTQTSADVRRSGKDQL